MNQVSKYYNGNELLSKNKLYNFIIGHRGVGKTYYFKRLVIRKFLKTGNQFIWIRRYKSELKEAKNKFFADISDEFKNVKLEIKGNQILVNDKIAGWFIPLSIASSFKSVPFPKVTSVVFDEFLIDKSTFKYIRNYDEPVIFLELYETIARDRENVSTYFIGNAISFANPYFIYFGVSQSNKEFFLKTELCVQHYKNELYIENKKKTRFGKLIAGSDYEKYAIENEYLNDKKFFIEKRTKNSFFRCAFFYKNKYLGVWKDLYVGKIFICSEYNKDSDRIFTLLNEEHRPNMIMLHGIKNTFSQELKFAFSTASIRFDNITNKAIFYEILTLL